MGETVDYIALVKTELDAMDESKCVQPSMPVMHFAHQGLIEHARLMDDRQTLEAGGMNFTIVDKLQIAAKALKQIQSQYVTVGFPTAASKQQWDDALEEADYLLYDMSAAARFALRNNPEYLEKVSLINQGSSHLDKIQDLSDFPILVNEAKPLFDAIQYDFANVKRAVELSDTMSNLYAQVTVDNSKSTQLTVLRNKAFTQVKTLLDDLIAQARYIHRGNKTKMSIHVIAPPRKKPVQNTASKKAAAEPVLAQ